MHRDLKPQNIMVRSNGEPVIIDLGIARFLDLESLTDTLNAIGPCTPIYAAPEQLTNQKHFINQRTDFFTLGIIILELLVGQHPFDQRLVGNDNTIVENIIEGVYVSPADRSECSDSFVDLVKRMLKVQQYQRFKNFMKLITFLDENWS